MLDFLAYELTGLGTGRFALPFVARYGFARLCFGHRELLIECAYSSKPPDVQRTSSFRTTAHDVQ
jgi:hypothetical protein